MARSRPAKQFPGVLRELAAAAPKAGQSALKEASKRLTAGMLQDFRNKEPGRSIFRSKFQTPRLEIKGRVARITAGAKFVMVLKGMAALLTRGGRTKPRTIARKRRKVLAFDGTSGRAFAPKVNHPGSRIRKTGIPERRIEQDKPAIRQALEKAMREQLRFLRLT